MSKRARKPVDWPWSSAATLLGLDEDGVTDAAPVRHRIPDLAALLQSAEDAEATMRLRRAESIGRPIGAKDWLEKLERDSGRQLTPAKRGRKGRVKKCTVTVIATRRDTQAKQLADVRWRCNSNLGTGMTMGTGAGAVATIGVGLATIGACRGG